MHLGTQTTELQRKAMLLQHCQVFLKHRGYFFPNVNTMCLTIPNALSSLPVQHQVTLQHLYVMFDILGTTQIASFIFMLLLTKPTINLCPCCCFLLLLADPTFSLQWIWTETFSRKAQYLETIHLSCILAFYTTKM